MIKSREDLSNYLAADKARYKKRPTLLDWFLHNEKWYIYNYLVSLRHVEYYINNKRKKDLRFLFWWFLYKRYSFITHITIFPNTCGKGLSIHHIGDMIWVKHNASIGENCTLRSGVVIGNKGDYKENAPVKIGRCVDFGLGVKIFGPLTIGDNVIIGANSVVTKDIPSNAIVAGVPAKIIKKI